MLILLGFLGLLLYFNPQNRFLTNLYYEMKYQIFWNSFIRFFFEAFLELAITSQITLISTQSI